jgi:hypothetical protein
VEFGFKSGRNEAILLTPFNKALKEKTGLNKVQLYNSVFGDLKNEWIKEDKTFRLQPILKLFHLKIRPIQNTGTITG